MTAIALLCCLSLASAQQRRSLKAKAWFGKSNNRKQSVPLSQHFRPTATFLLGGALINVAAYCYNTPGSKKESSKLPR